MEEKTTLEGVAAKNFKGLKEVDLDFRHHGHLIIFGGDESAGKSTAMEILKATLYGKENCPTQPIRKGEKEAWTETRFSDLIARRVFTAKGTRLDVKAKRDLPPQEWLTKLFGIDKAKALSVNPLDLFDLPQKQLIDKLQKAVGLDFTELDEKRRVLYGQRHDLNQEVRNLSERVESIQIQSDAPDQPVVIADLLEERVRREEINRGNRIVEGRLTELRREASVGKEVIHRIKDEIAGLEAELFAKRDHLAGLKEEHARLVSRGKEVAAEVTTLVDADLQEIDNQLASAEEQNVKLRMNQERTELADRLQVKSTGVLQLSEQIEAIDEKKAAALASAQFSIEGLAFDEERVLFNGIDIRQAARNEKIRMGVALVLALNPKAPAIIIDEGTGLSAESLGVLAELGEKYQKYILVGRTSKGSEVTFLMKDGEVAKEADSEGSSETGGG